MTVKSTTVQSRNVRSKATAATAATHLIRERGLKNAVYDAPTRRAIVVSQAADSLAVVCVPNDLNECGADLALIGSQADDADLQGARAVTYVAATQHALVASPGADSLSVVACLAISSKPPSVNRSDIPITRMRTCLPSSRWGRRLEPFVA